MQIIQSATTTHLFRNTQTLYAARRQMGGHPAPRILSFGCSRGDELVTLRMMFPGAQILGCDINETIMEVARAEKPGIAEIFTSDDAAILAHGPYDLIVAFSSLCVYPPPKDQPMSEAFPFSRFCELLDLFHDCLVPGGVLALHNTCYVPRHVPGMARFDVVRCDEIATAGFVQLFGPDHSLLLSSYHGIRSVVDIGPLEDEDLTDSVYVKRADPAAAATVRIVPSWQPPADRGHCVAAWSRWNLSNMPERFCRTALASRQFYEGYLRPDGRSFVETWVERTHLKTGAPILTARTGFYAEPV